MGFAALPVSAGECDEREGSGDGDLVALPARVRDPGVALTPQGGAHPQRLARVLPLARGIAVLAPALPARRRADAQLGDLLATLRPPHDGVGAQVAGNRRFNCHSSCPFR